MLLESEEFASYADAADALKFRLAKLRISYLPDEISEAFRVVEASRPIVRPPAGLERRTSHVERLEPTPRPITRDEARAILERAAAVVREMR